MIKAVFDVATPIAGPAAVIKSIGLSVMALQRLQQHVSFIQVLLSTRPFTL
jgi:hypothetical protein